MRLHLAVLTMAATTLAAQTVYIGTRGAEGVYRAHFDAATGTISDVKLAAKTLNPILQISARVGEESAELKMRRAGASFVFAPYVSTGHRMAQALLKPHVLQFLDYTLQEREAAEAGIEQIRIEPGSFYSHKTVAEVAAQKGEHVVLLAVRRSSGQMIYNPAPTVELAGGDYLIVMGERGGLARLEKMLAV